ncbi:hypothetical protein BD769DRAFT_1369725, partial [Suillus cothurnatus]
LKKGADAAHSDDTSSLKELVAGWVNQEFCLSPLIKSNDKYLRGFASDICGKLLCPAEWDWAGIWDRTSEYIVSENSWPLFIYENHQVNSNDLKEGFLKSKLLVLVSGLVSYPIHSRFSSEVPDVRSNQIQSTDLYRIRHDKLLHSYPVHITLNTAYFLHLVYPPFQYISYVHFWLCLLIRSPVINFWLMFDF